MEVYALVGPSGSGKSHRALVVGHQYQIDTVIDDGLLIKKNRIIAGRSAKRAPSKISAVLQFLRAPPPIIFTLLVCIFYPPVFLYSNDNNYD